MQTNKKNNNRIFFFSVGTHAAPPLMPPWVAAHSAHMRNHPCIQLPIEVCMVAICFLSLQNHSKTQIDRATAGIILNIPSQIVILVEKSFFFFC